VLGCDAPKRADPHGRSQTAIEQFGIGIVDAAMTQESENMDRKWTRVQQEEARAMTAMKKGIDAMGEDERVEMLGRKLKKLEREVQMAEQGELGPTVPDTGATVPTAAARAAVAIDQRANAVENGFYMAYTLNRKTQSQ
jgi:hypothetical protein